MPGDANRFQTLLQGTDFDLRIAEGSKRRRANKVTLNADIEFDVVPCNKGKDPLERQIDGAGKWNDAGVSRAEAEMARRGRDRWGQQEQGRLPDHEESEVVGRRRPIPRWVWVTGVTAVIVVVVLVVVLVGL